MFPNPQSALPLPPRPSLERYRKIAKDLVKACRSASESGDLDAGPDWAEEWAADWIDALVRLSGLVPEPRLPVRIQSWIEDVAAFAQHQLSRDAAGGRTCALADAQFVIARSHGFESWPKFVRCLEAMAASQSSESRFEAAADAIAAGDIVTLKRLLDEEPGMVRARSMREHGATLLHYVSANGVEGYRQKTPRNVVEIAEVLLQAGAEVDATANVYGGGSTTLGLAATSVHPERAGVQEELLRTLLEHGARIPDSMVRVCLANGRVKAAEFVTVFLEDRVGSLSLAEAAGVGRLDLVEARVAETTATPEQMRDGFLFACQFGRDAVVDFLLGKGVDPAECDERGQTGLHHSVLGGHPTTVELLIEYKPPLEARNAYGGTVLEQALWSAAHDGDPEAYIAILEALVAAGAKLPSGHVPVNARVDAWLEQHGSHAEPGWYWNGERPRSEKRQKLPR
jgi:ankyrin repeat protein